MSPVPEHRGAEVATCGGVLINFAIKATSSRSLYDATLFPSFRYFLIFWYPKAIIAICNPHFTKLSIFGSCLLSYAGH